MFGWGGVRAGDRANEKESKSGRKKVPGNTLVSCEVSSVPSLTEYQLTEVRATDERDQVLVCEVASRVVFDLRRVARDIMDPGPSTASAVQHDRLLHRKTATPSNIVPSQLNAAAGLSSSASSHDDHSSRTKRDDDLTLSPHHSYNQHKSSSTSLLDKVSHRRSEPVLANANADVVSVQGFEDDFPDNRRLDWIYAGVIFLLAALLRFWAIHHPAGVV